MDSNAASAGSNFNYDKSSEDFAAFMSSFREMNGRIKSISEVVNLPVIQAIENSRAEQFKKLSESLKQFTNAQFPGLNNNSTSSTSNAASNNTTQQVAMEQMFRNITNTRQSEEGISGERGKLKDPDAEKKNLDTLGNKILTSLKGGFDSVSSSVNRLKSGLMNLVPPEARSAWAELRSLLIGGGILLGIGKLLGIPLADAVLNVLKTGFDYLIDSVGSKLSDKFNISLENMKTGLKVAAAAAITGVVFGFKNIFNLFSGAVGLFLKGVTKMAKFMFGPGVPRGATPTTGARGPRGAGSFRRTPRAPAGQLGAPKPSTLSKTVRGVGTGAGRLLAGVGVGFAGYAAYQDIEQMKEYEKAGMKDAAGWSKWAAWLNGISAGTGAAGLGMGVTGIGLPVAAGLGVASLVSGGLGMLAEWRAGSLAEQKMVEMAEKVNVKTEQEYSERLKEMRKNALEKNSKRKELWDKKMQSDMSPQLSFENSLENLGETIDKSIATLMDWDRRGLNPLQAVAETLQRSMAPHKKDAPSQTNPTSVRDSVHSDRERARASLKTFALP